MDCDATLDPMELSSLATPVMKGSVDLALGRRSHEHGSWPLPARLANRLLTVEIRRRTGLVLTDLGPMRAARREGLLELNLRDRRFGWPLEMVIKAHQAGWRFLERPVQYLPRRGASKVTGTAGGTFRTVRDMAAVLRLSPTGR